MSNKWGIKPEQAEVLFELEKMIGKSIPLVGEIEWDTVGVKIEQDNIIGLGLYKCKLITTRTKINS